MATSNEFERDEDRLPWLETVEPDEPHGSGAGRKLLLVLVGLLVLGAAISGLYRLQVGRGADGSGELIAAQEGDYKVKPDDPGGLKVEGEGDTAIATSAGANPNGSIDLKAVPEAPISGTRRTAPDAARAGATSASVSIPAASAPSPWTSSPVTSWCCWIPPGTPIFSRWPSRSRRVAWASCRSCTT